ncbi:MAG: hypothetical protein ACRENI_14410 [Gemmatimonadaceae bacterium]
MSTATDTVRPAEATPPILSVIVVIVSDTIERATSGHLEGCLEAMVSQSGAPAMEVIVPHHRWVAGMAEAQRRFRGVRFIGVDDLRHRPGEGRDHHDELRARGLAAARGDIVAMLEDHARPDAGWAASLTSAHRASPAAIGGAIENGIDRALNWAVYFCDFGRYQNPLPPGPSAFASDANVSYKRAALEAIRPVWGQSFHETAVHQALAERGDTVVLSPEIVVRQWRRGLRPGLALRERFVWGRSYAATRSTLVGRSRAIAYAALAPALLPLLLLRMLRTVLRKGRCRGAFLRALPLTALLTASWSLGELTGYVTGDTR